MDFSSEDDGFAAIIEKIKNVDGLIVGGPIYWGTVRAQLMTALQRIAMASAQQGNFLSRMVGGPIAVARRGGSTTALQEMMMFYLSNDMIVPGSTYWNIVFGQAPGQAMQDEEGIKTIQRFGENVAFVLQQCMVSPQKRLLPTADLKCPVLIIAGSKDPYVSPALCREAYQTLTNPDSQCVIINGAAHAMGYIALGEFVSVSLVGVLLTRMLLKNHRLKDFLTHI